MLNASSDDVQVKGFRTGTHIQSVRPEPVGCGERCIGNSKVFLHLGRCDHLEVLVYEWGVALYQGKRRNDSDWFIFHNAESVNSVYPGNLIGIFTSVTDISVQQSWFGALMTLQLHSLPIDP